jgi:hypothetical protein
MTLPTYEKSFNKVVNDALMYGLPKLYAAEFGIPEQEEAPKPEQSGRDIGGDSFLKIVRLLREVIINENINKKNLAGKNFRVYYEKRSAFSCRRL